MQGSIVSDLTGGVMVRAGGASATDPATLPPDWLTLLMDGDAQALLAALPAHVRVPEHASGSRAEEHAVRADLQRALAQGDSGTERNCCARLAALLWARGVSRREAIALTHRAVALRDDDETRLLLVARLEHLGLLSDAAAALAPCVSRSATAREAAELLIRMATDQVRAGDPQSAMKNLLEAATARHGSGQVQDLAGTLAGALGLPETSTIFLEAAERYDAAGNAEGAFTARRRAFEFAPADARACDALVASLRGMQRHEAADAVLRRHARASAPERSHATHIARLQASLAADDGARALVAVIDGRLESAVAGAEERWVDEAFSRAGLHELVALRCELRAQATQGAARAREYLALASLYVDRLAAPDRALEAWIAALQADPLCGEARASLRTVTRAMQDQSALMEGLLRAATATRDTTVAIDCLRELAKLAEDRLAEPSLASWAYARMAQLGASGLDLEQARARLVPRLRLQQSALATAREAAQKTDQPTRIEAIRRIATILRGRPDELDAYLEALQELLSQGVAERRWWVEFERAATRAERYDLLASVARKRLAAGIPRADAAHLQSLLVMLAVRKGDMASVAQEAHALADAVPGIRLAICAGWLAHAALGDEQARATAIERAASLLAMPMKATLLACAGEIYVQLGQLQQAHRLAEQARQVDAAEPQVLSFSGAMAAFTRDPALHRLAEKAWSIYLPDGEQHQGLVLAFTEAGDPLPAYMWVRRWLDLRPWDTAVLQRLVDAAVATHSAETLAAALGRVLQALLSTQDLMQIVDSAVRAYAGLSPSRAAAAALDAIEHGGAAVFAWRDRFEQLAHEARAPRILVELAERILALSPCDDAAALLAATDAHLYASDMDGAAHALVRAVAAGATPDDVLRRLEQLTPLSGDGRLDATTARAMALTAAGLAQEASDQWLRVGALRWDLGDNTVGAIDAWCTALRGTDARSLGRVAGLAALFAGAELASEALRNHALLHPSLSTSTGALVAAAALAIAAGKPATANEMALQAIERDPRRTDALVVAERASDVLGDPGAADSAYVAVARGAKGRFGKRAAHYRAARTLEQRGMYDLAVVHAIAAFETDPAPGSALALMVRIASHVDPGEVIATLRGVAGAAEGPEARAYWLLQAAGAAKQDHAHLQTALDLGLGALVASPDSGAALLIWDVALRLLANDPSDRDVLEVRLQRALRAVAPRLEGPRGARVALSLARFCVEVLEAPSLAIAWAEAALSTSGDIDEYDQLTGFAPSLAQDFDRAAAFVDTVIHHAASMSGTVGPALYALAEAMARALGDPGRADAVAHACAKHNQDAHAEQEYVDPFADLTDTPATASQQDAPEKQDDTCAEHRAESHTVPGIGPSPVGRVASVLAQGILWEALRLEREGDPQAAIDLLARAHDREPAHQASFDEVLRRLYLATGRTWELEQLLDRCNARSTSATEKVGLLLELVELAEARSDASAVRLRWLQLAELDPNHHDAAKFLEDDALDRGDFEGLVELLRRRAQAAGSVRQLRALLARRAVILTDELGRSAQATREIDALLEEHGDDPELLLLRARIEEQDRGAVCAAPYLLRAAQLTVPRGDAESLCIRAAWAYLDVNDVRGASHAISLVSGSHSPDVLHVLVAIEQRGGNPEVLGTLLDELATGSTQSADQKALWLVQAAGAALQAGQTGAALERASRAIELAPNDPHVQLRAVFVGYRADGLGDDGSVQTMLRRLQNVADRIGTSDIPLHAYLVAEAVERLQSPQAAIDYLNSRRRVAGLAPLIALGLADRLAAAGDAEAAIPYFQIALKSDDLQGVRSKTQVAFQAARAALRVGGRIAAAPFIEQVETDPGAQELAERLQAELAEIAPPAEEMQRQLDQIARAARRSERAQALLQLARLSAGRRTRGADAQADSFFAEALSAAATDEALRAQILRERDAFRATLAPSQAPLPVPLGAGPSSVPPLPPSTQFTQALAPELRAARAASTAPPQPPRDVSSHPPAGPATRMLSRAGGFVSDRPAAHPHHSPVSESNEERALFAQLAGGDLDAGDTLAEMLARHTERAHDLVAVRRRQVVHAPHDTRLLALLGEAADADLNRPLARAVQHVVGVLTGKPTVAPPPVSSQAGDPERMLAMTVRGVHGCAAEVLGNVWTHASHLFVRDPAAYGLTGVERVALSSPSNLGHAYASAARALGLARTPLFYRRTTGSPQLAIAMLSPIAVVASGDFRDERNVLAYRVAFMLAAATPANGMLFGMPPNAIRQLLQALVAAFGPPEASRGKQGETAVLAGELWRALPGRVQRRVHEAFRDPTPPAYEDAWARGLQSSRRAGLLVVGDLAVALRDVMEDPGLRGLVDVGAPDAFLSVCKQSGSAADLVRFATSAEYAEARWRDDVGRRTSSPDLR